MQRDYDEVGTSLTIVIRKDDLQTLCERLSKILSLRFVNCDEEE